MCETQTPLVDELLPGLELWKQARSIFLGKGKKPPRFSTEEAMEEAHMWLVLGEKTPKELNMALERHCARSFKGFAPSCSGLRA